METERVLLLRSKPFFSERDDSKSTGAEEVVGNTSDPKCFGARKCCADQMRNRLAPGTFGDEKAVGVATRKLRAVIFLAF